MTYPHTAVWIDQKEAHIFHVEAESFTRSTVHATGREVEHQKREMFGEKNHPQDEQHFFQNVEKELGTAQGILLLGPSTAKFHFLKHVQKHTPALASRIVATETVDHPSDGQMAAYIRNHFLTASPKQDSVP